MTLPPPSPNASLADCAILDEIATLEALDRLLVAETMALAKLDFAAIDQARIDKEAMEPTLVSARDRRREAAGPLSPKLRAQHQLVSGRILKRSAENGLRLETCLQGISGLIQNLTGTRPNIYGRNGLAQGTQANPVLTSTVG